MIRPDSSKQTFLLRSEVVYRYVPCLHLDFDFALLLSWSGNWMDIPLELMKESQHWLGNHSLIRRDRWNSLDKESSGHPFDPKRGGQNPPILPSFPPSCIAQTLRMRFFFSKLTLHHTVTRFLCSIMWYCDIDSFFQSAEQFFQVVFVV